MMINAVHLEVNVGVMIRLQLKTRVLQGRDLSHTVFTIQGQSIFYPKGTTKAHTVDCQISSPMCPGPTIAHISSPVVCLWSLCIISIWDTFLILFDKYKLSIISLAVKKIILRKPILWHISHLEPKIDLLRTKTKRDRQLGIDFQAAPLVKFSWENNYSFKKNSRNQIQTQTF